jgi:hypothetical protein
MSVLQGAKLGRRFKGQRTVAELTQVAVKVGSSVRRSKPAVDAFVSPSVRVAYNEIMPARGRTRFFSVDGARRLGSQREKWRHGAAESQGRRERRQLQ